MVTLQCEVPNCTISKTADDLPTALQLLQLHDKQAHGTAAAVSMADKQKAPKIDRPTINQSCTEEDWAAFSRRWDLFKSGTALHPSQVTPQLIACCETELESALFRDDPQVASKSADIVLTSIKRLAVIGVALSARHAATLKTCQEPGEPIHNYVSRLRGKAHVCNFTSKGSCGNDACIADFTDDMVKMIMINGLADEDVKKDILSTTDIDDKTLADTVSLIDSKEIAARAMMATPTVAVSSYKKSKKPPQGDQTIKIKCTDCARAMPKVTMVRGRPREFKKCRDCWDKNRAAKTPEQALFQVVGVIHSQPQMSLFVQKRGKVAVRRPDRYTFKGPGLGWRVADALPHPTLSLQVSTDLVAYDEFDILPPPASSARQEVVADSGAQVCIMGINRLHQMGLRKRDLIPVQRRVQAANGEDLTILGALFLTYTGYDKGVPVKTCGCLLRTTPPPRPAQLPFSPTPENTPKMRNWLVNRFASSSFNKCPHQPLPAMPGPPMEITVDPKARAYVTRRPANTPLHWKEEISSQLKRDEMLGVIERVPPNTPVTWMHPTVYTPKADGSPRRTVDLQSLNKYCVRDTHHCIPPAQQARSVPPNTVRTVLDAWNGFHSIEIREEDRHLTTFLTEEGRFRYKRAPMGFLASQDAYTHRYDNIIADVERKTKCVDDTLLWDDRDDLGKHWWRIIDYLILTGSNGVTLHPEPEKFQFSTTSVNFAGFHLSESAVRPLPKYLDAIATFPRPANIQDARSWFGLVTQVAHYGRLTDLMAPFRPLLSPKTAFDWTPELEAAFQHSRAAIVQEIRDGVEIFDLKRKTCLTPDWSKQGIGYWLRQKHCECDSVIPGCCPTGWRVTLAGSRFLRDAEQRYAPIEGEALAVAWALEDTKFFSLGCKDLVVATDHKPLVKILGDRCLGDNDNMRIFRLKQRTLKWRFQIVHIPGHLISASDATSRHPAGAQQFDDPAHVLAILRVDLPDSFSVDGMVLASASAGIGSLGAVTWPRVRTATQNDNDLVQLRGMIESGFPESRNQLPENLQPYWQHRNDLYVTDGVIMKGHRILIPPVLRPQVLEILHAAHQGTARMASRAQASVFWPGASVDIDNVRRRCIDCWRMAPSQSHMPPATPMVPTAPFQAVAADYFHIQGKHYLVIVDRFSGWPHIVFQPSGAKDLVKVLIAYFSTFGVSAELGSDGGPEFTARETAAFLDRWGVCHRLSAAYNHESNGRAEVAVKSMKRLLTSHTDAKGRLDTEAVAAGLLQYPNTPDPDSGLSPAQIIFGKPMRDLMPVMPEAPVFTNNAVHPLWRETWAKQEDALRLRFARQAESRRHGSKAQPPLIPGDRVLVQNQAGVKPNRWDRTGTVVEVRPHDQHVVRVDGSGRLTLRNRQFLRKVVPIFGPALPLMSQPHPYLWPGPRPPLSLRSVARPPQWPRSVHPCHPHMLHHAIRQPPTWMLIRHPCPLVLLARLTLRLLWVLSVGLTYAHQSGHHLRPQFLRIPQSSRRAQHPRPHPPTSSPSPAPRLSARTRRDPAWHKDYVMGGKWPKSMMITCPTGLP